jgi:WD40 repeat protein
MTDPGAHHVIARLPTGLRASIEDAQVLFSPTAPILASSDGQLLSSIWNISDPAAPRKLHGVMFTPAGPVYCMAFRPDGRQLAIGSEKSTIFLYQVTAQGDIGRQGSVVYGGSLGSGISTVSYGPDGRTLAASSGSAARLWNITNPRHPVTLANLADHSGSITALAFSRPSIFTGHSVLVTAGNDDVAYEYEPDLSKPSTYTVTTYGEPMPWPNPSQLPNWWPAVASTRSRTLRTGQCWRLPAPTARWNYGTPAIRQS